MNYTDKYIHTNILHLNYKHAYAYIIYIVYSMYVVRPSGKL